MSAEYKYSARNKVFERTGYIVQNKIATTLQGSIYFGSHDTKEPCVLKRTSIQLYEKNAGIMHNRLCKVNENIVKEAKVLKYLTSLPGNVPGLTKFIDFWYDTKNFFLIMEYGGEALLQHVMIMHKYIRQKKLKISVWKEHVTILFKQMCLFMNWLHNVAKICHLDISLENLSIKGCIFENGKFISHGQIYFIDYGVATCFTNLKTFDNCTQFVGKESYQSPKVFDRKPFNASKADIWSLGVVFFMMLVGGQPFRVPNKCDLMFCNIIGGYLQLWLKDLKMDHYMDNDLLKLFGKIFCNENDRITIDNLVKLL